MTDKINMYDINKGKLNHLGAFYKAWSQPIKVKPQHKSKIHSELLEELFDISPGSVRTYLSKKGLSLTETSDVVKYIQEERKKIQ